MHFATSIKSSLVGASRALLHIGFLLAIGPLVACSADTGSTRHPTLGSAGTSGAAGGTAAAGNGDFGNTTSSAPPAPGGTGGGTGANGCAPGHYVGSFDGVYNSAAWGNGSFPLTIEAVASMGRPGLEFWLEKTSAPCTSSEFCADFSVKGGKIRGFANPFSDPNAPKTDASVANPFAVAVRFEIDFAGELDCSTGEFKGLLHNGCYDVATVLYRFEGTAPAKYDRAQSKFNEGKWAAKETPMTGVIFPPDSKIGGTGTWDAKLVDEGSSPVAAGMGLCDK